MKKLLVFGGNGFVGGNLVELALEQGWQVVVADLAAYPRVDGARWIGVDITQPDQIQQAFQETKPDAVVNVAALADIDRVERARELAWKINVDGARWVAHNCATNGTPYVFFSSDAVFDGLHGPYAEDDQPKPVNYYGVTKAEAEMAVLTSHPGAAVIRISLVLGLPLTAGNSFVAGLLEKLRAGRAVLCPLDEIRTPVDVHTLSACVLELVSVRFSGLLHIGCTDSVDRFSLTRRLAQEMGYSHDLVRAQTDHEELPGRAPRHKYGILDVSKARRVLNTHLPSLDETIHRALNQNCPVSLIGEQAK